MTSTAALLQRLAPGGPRDPARARARAWLDVHGMPTGREEQWRYTPLDDVMARLELAAPAVDTTVSASLLDDLAGRHGATRVVFVNGTYSAELSDQTTLPDGLRFGPLRDLPRSVTATARLLDSAEPFDGFHALNRAAGRDATLVQTSAGFELDEPLHLVHLTAPGDRLAASHPRTIVELGEESRLEVVETYCGLPGAAFTNASTVVHIGRGGSLTHRRVQQESGEAVHLGHTRVEQARGTRLHATSLMLGASIARHALDVLLNGVEARSDLDGIYAPSGTQRHDTAITVDHAASRCTSTQRFKGVVDDRARGSFSGRIIVRPDTVGSDASQTNQNLVLQPTAQADTRPWLEIFADDVRCTHGATVGRLDDEALFYLRSRGIPLEESRTMLVEAFVREITDGISPASLAEHVAAATAALGR